MKPTKYFAEQGKAFARPFPTLPDPEQFLFVGNQPQMLKIGQRYYAKFPEELVDVDGTMYRLASPRFADYSDKEKKLIGVKFEGVMCSATESDQNGLTAAYLSITVLGKDFPFHFENGNVLLLTSANYMDFMAVWQPFRASFYTI